MYEYEITLIFQAHPLSFQEQAEQRRIILFRLRSYLGAVGLALALTLSTTSVWADVPLANISGDMPSELRERVVEAIGEVEKQPRSVAQAKRRTETALKLARAVLRSEGYYGFEIDPQFQGYGDAPTKDVSELMLTPVLVIKTGPRFVFGSSRVNLLNTPNTQSGDDVKTGTAPPNTLIAPDIDFVSIMDLEEGTPAQAARVVAAELRLINILKSKGYPDAVASPRKAVVDHDGPTLSVTYNIYAGPKTRFGQIIKTGNATLSEGWPTMVAPFKSGDVYSDIKLNRLSARIIGTGVFDSVTATLAPETVTNADGTLTRNIALNVEQEAKNTISGELGYSTSDGSGLSLTYERRNYVGYAQTLTLTSAIKTNLIDFGAQYNIPFLGRVDRELNIAGEIAQENSESFRGERLTAEMQLTQKVSRRLKATAGLALEASQFREENTSQEKTKAYLVQGQALAEYDTRENILNPIQGYRIEASVRPTYNFGESPGFFTIGEASASHYRKVADSLVVAGRVKYGSILGADLASVPLNQRFYGGGGGSVRGYSFQSISPRDSTGERIGGRAIFEGSAELRYRAPETLLNGNLGFVGFVDAASVSARDYPDFDRVLAGAGVGVRYYTSFAPLRADIAIPLNKRADDPAVQFYISIGQSF